MPSSMQQRRLEVRKNKGWKSGWGNNKSERRKKNCSVRERARGGQRRGTWPTLRSSATTRTTRSPPASLGSSKPTPSTVQAGVADLPSLPNMANMAFQRIEILTYTICSNFEGSGWVNDLFLPFLWWFEKWMMAQMKVNGISDKVMGLSSPRTMFFISLEPVKVLSAKYGRTRYCKG